MPVDFYIPHRQPNEKLILLLRRHPLIIWGRLGSWLLVGLAPIALYLILNPILANLIYSEIGLPIIVLGLSIYYLYLWLFIFTTFVDYYLDVWIVTNDRIINIEQKGLFARTVSEQKLYRIQDVTSEIQGFFSTTFDFGTVHIQTAGEQERFVFKQIPNPAETARKISQLAEENKKLHSPETGEENN